MNKILENLNLDECLFIDIETVHQETLPPMDLLQWQFRDKEKDELATIQDAENAFYKKGALFPEMGRIVCISLGMIEGDTINIKSLTGDEPTILKTLVKLIKKRKFILVGFNIKAFDLPYIRKRAMVNDLEYFSTPQGNDSGIKPWDMDSVVVDLMEHWKGANYANTSLELLCYALGISSPKVAIRGSEVSAYYYKHGVEDIAKYCERDVLATANVLRRLRKESLLTLSECEPAEKTLGMVEQIKAEGKVTETLWKELRKKVKDMNDKEREHTIDIINSALVLGGNSLTDAQKNDILTYKKK